MRNLTGARDSGSTLTVSDSNSDVSLAFAEQCLTHDLRVPPADSWIFATAKRGSDIVAASALILFSSPVMLATALLLWLDDHGPVFHSTTVVGRHGKSFKSLRFRVKHLTHNNETSHSPLKNSKFREISANSSSIAWCLNHFDVENLPMLFSVLAGHMSIVGPRVKSPHEAVDLSPEQQVYQLVKPGIICLQEVRKQTDLSFAEWPDADLEYVMNRSLRLDLKIFAHAWPTLLFCLKKK